jgi:hypothetical protein
MGALANRPLPPPTTGLARTTMPSASTMARGVQLQEGGREERFCASVAGLACGMRQPALPCCRGGWQLSRAAAPTKLRRVAAVTRELQTRVGRTAQCTMMA